MSSTSSSTSSMSMSIGMSRSRSVYGHAGRRRRHKSNPVLLLLLLLAQLLVQAIDAALLWTPFEDTSDDLSTTTIPTCADGSPAGMFVEDVHAANPVDVTRHVIVLTGGGACTDPSDCLDSYEMEPFKFSSKQLPPQIQGHTILSSLAAKNPTLHKYRKWLLPYCTQDFFLGSQTTPASDSNFIHGGEHVLTASLELWKDLAIKDLLPNQNITQVVVVGLSAGAVGVMNQLPLIRRILADAHAENVKFILDAPTVLSDQAYTDKDFNDMMLRTVNLTQHPYCNPQAPISRLYSPISALPCCLSSHCMWRHHPSLTQYYDNNPTPFVSDTMLVLDSAYDTFALAAGTVDDGGNNDKDDSHDKENKISEDHEDVNDAWSIVESAGRRKARVLETAILAQWQQMMMLQNDNSNDTDSNNLLLLPDDNTLQTSTTKSRVQWIFASCVTHTFLLPALEFLELSCRYGNYEDEDFDIVCNATGFATRFSIDNDNIRVLTWRTIDTWDLVQFENQSIHQIIDAFVVSSTASSGHNVDDDDDSIQTTTTAVIMEDDAIQQSQQQQQSSSSLTTNRQLLSALHVQLEDCYGPNCMPLGSKQNNNNDNDDDYDTPSCQSMVQVDATFRAVPMPFTIFWTVLLVGFVSGALLLRIASTKEEPEQGNQQSILDRYKRQHPSATTTEQEQDFLTTATAMPVEEGRRGSLYGSLQRELSARRNNGKDFTLKDIRVQTDKGAILLEIQQLALAYGTVNGICGRSGAGKSTLLKALSLLQRSGVRVSMSVGGGALRNMRRAFLRQDDAVAFGQLTPSEYLYWSASIYGTDPHMFENLYMFAEGLFHRGGNKNNNNNKLNHSTGEQPKVMHPFYDTKIAQLSGGQKRILSIATTLLLDPNILLLDEPLSGLDSVSSLQVMTSLQYIVERCGCIALLTVHQPSDAILEFFDRLLVVSAGKLALNSRISDGGVKAVSSRLNSLLCDSHRRTSMYMSQAFTQTLQQESGTGDSLPESMAFTNALDNSVHLFNTTHHRRASMFTTPMHMSFIEESAEEESSSEMDGNSFQEASSTKDECYDLMGGTQETSTDHTQATTDRTTSTPSTDRTTPTMTNGKLAIDVEEFKLEEEVAPKTAKNDNQMDSSLQHSDSEQPLETTSLVERIVACVAIMCCCDSKVKSQIRPLIQRVQLEYGWGFKKDIVPANVAIAIVALVLTTQETLTFRIVALTVALVGIPVIVFPHKVFQYAEMWKFHKRELDDLRISLVAFQVSTSMFSFSMPVVSLTLAQAIGYAIVGLDYGSFLNQLLFSVLHLLVALQFGRSLAVLFQGDNPSIVQVFTFYLFLSFLLSSTLVASYKFPVEIRWIHWFSIDFWAISGAVMNQLDKDVSYSNDEDCFDFVTCLLSDGGLIVSVLGYSPMSTSYLALGVLSIWFVAFVVFEHAMLHYRCEGR
ncbi:transporter G family member [Seminavis robusta]|uniref:Transporter G family member n=1 Tax=Seminavis robusta TaxID=568900 RepID=A0A9N8H4B8_9STRA|nr:transporter G family member [Seminavis robusta]|eukprot:Sro81_g043470.1 transporter G family member (1430) ;mRNA; f:50317-54606